MRAKALVLATLSVVVTGCATHLHVWNDKESDLKGIPVRLGEVFVKRGKYTKSSRDADSPCRMQEFYDIVILPTGSTYYVNVDSDWLAKAEFAVSYHDNGTLAGVSMNSDVAGGVKAATESLTQLLPFAGMLPAVADKREQPEPPSDSERGFVPSENNVERTSEALVPLCDGAPADISFVPFTQFQEAEGD